MKGGTVGIRLIKIGIVYLLVGMSLGVFMGATKDFTFRDVHAHINLLGWTLLGISGLIFNAFPELEAYTLSKVFFWLYNVSILLTLVMLALWIAGNTAVDPLLGIGSVLIVVATACFAWVVLTKLPVARRSA